MEVRHVPLRAVASEPVRILLAVVLAFALAQLILAGLFAREGVVSEAMLTPKQLAPYQGSGGAVSAKKARFHADAQGQLIVITPDLKGHFNTRDYAAIRVLGKNMPLKDASAILILPDRKKLPLKQASDSKPGALRFTIPATQVAPLHGLALLFQGVQGSTPVVIDSVRFEPRHPVPLLRAWKTLWRDWLTPEGWQLYSVNFIKGGKVEDLRSSPAAAGLLWFVLALLIWWGIRVRPHKIQAGVAIALMGLLIWTVVDFRWQMDQWRSLGRWLDGGSAKAQAVSGSFASIQRIDSFARQLRALLPQQGNRLFVVTRNYNLQARLLYDLLPMNGYWMPGMYDSNVRFLQTGDYLVMIGAGSEAQFDAARHLLVGKRYVFPARQLMSSGGVQVYQMTGSARSRGRS